MGSNIGQSSPSHPGGCEAEPRAEVIRTEYGVPGESKVKWRSGVREYPVPAREGVEASGILATWELRCCEILRSL